VPRGQRGSPVDRPAPDVIRAATAPSRRAVEDALRAEGLDPRVWANGAGVLYDDHAHARHKVLVCVSGGIVFHTDRGDLALGPGDRMELPPGVVHGATVTGAGVECVEAFRPERGPDTRR
jgi:mannose-6-phosphate isomerase-like protein (cupin superfamily)